LENRSGREPLVIAGSQKNELRGRAIGTLVLHGADLLVAIGFMAE
jgi:hypothetical protein